jgi:hypothetical protein
MQSKATTVDAYLEELPEDRRNAIQALREAISAGLPTGFEEGIGYGMIGYAVPHSIYPAGYHCNPTLPLPFMSIASQKNFVAVYHMGIYANPELMAWFLAEYPKHSSAKLDMGKSCLRFKKMDQIPYAFIGELASKMTPQDWISVYESAFRHK